MASNSPTPMWIAHDAASDDAYCRSWPQLLHLHQRRIALWQRSSFPHDALDSPPGPNIVHFLPEGPLTAHAPTGCPTSSLPAPSRCSAAPVTALPTAQKPPSEFPYSTGTLTEHAPTGCPTYSPPTPSRCTPTSLTALPTAQRPASELLYSTGTSCPVEQLPVEAQLPSILWDVRCLQDLVIHQHNQLRAQELLSAQVMFRQLLLASNPPTGNPLPIPLPMAGPDYSECPWNTDPWSCTEDSSDTAPDPTRLPLPPMKTSFTAMPFLGLA